MDDEKMTEEEIIDECNEMVEENCSENTFGDGVTIEDAPCTEENQEVTPKDEGLDQKVTELQDKLQRTLAEFDNFRKRTMKEKTSMYDDGVRDTVEKVLPIIDNIQRAIASQEGKSEDNDPLLKGVLMIEKQLLEAFKAIGVEEIPAVGKKFDPNLHAAVAHIEDEKVAENEITIELLKGYKHKDKVIRHSMVQVAN